MNTILLERVRRRISTKMDIFNPSYIKPMSADRSERETFLIVIFLWGQFIKDMVRLC